MDDVYYNIDAVVENLKTETSINFKLINEMDAEYVAMGEISEQELLDIGFEFIGYSDYVKCPMYRLGKNIEAIFDDTILHIYTIL